MNIEKANLSYLGQTVTVTVDRPLGSKHPDCPDMIYPIKYGYVEGITAPDNEPQDAYILGVDKPVDSFTGRVAAIIVRENDVEDKWVVVPEELYGGEICWECNIRNAVNFQEQYFKSKIYPKFEKTCGAVLFTEKDGERHYLLVCGKSGHIGFPKGHTEYGETERENALREIFEETGIKTQLMDGFREEYTFTTLENTIKTGAFFLAHYDYRQIKRQEEEITEDWLLPYEKALHQLNWKEDKAVLEAAENYLNAIDRA